MQPLAYLAVRAFLGWLQYIERSARAFVSIPLLTVATGAVHSWAVVYALFVSVHTRAMRYEGYHEGYEEHLPRWVFVTEMLSIASMWVWLLAGFTTAAVRLLDEDAEALPMGMADAKVSPVIKFMRSKLLQNLLHAAHSVSCMGLFIGILLLCLAMAAMRGGITVCEVCLVFVAVSFAVPHAIVAARRFFESGGVNLDEVLAVPAFEAAAREAAALGPQVCVILAVADSPGHAYFWQNLVYATASACFLGAVVACGRHPPKVSGAALPPEPLETIICLVLDTGAALLLIKSFPHLSTWLLWVSTAVFIFSCAAMLLPEWREIVVDLLDPLLVVRSDTHKRVPSGPRQRMRLAAWVACVLCTLAALWDISFHTVPVPVPPPPPSSKEVMLFRWDERLKRPENQELLTAAAGALGLTVDDLEVAESFPKHRLLAFKAKANGQIANVSAVPGQWKEAVRAREGELEKLLEVGFPGEFDSANCDLFKASDDRSKAITAVCQWWHRQLAA